MYGIIFLTKKFVVYIQIPYLNAYAKAWIKVIDVLWEGSIRGRERSASGEVKDGNYFVTYILLYYLNLFKKLRPKEF